MTESAQERRADVSAGEAGARLDKFLSQKLEGLSRARIQALLEQGHVRCGAPVADASRKVREGEVYTVSIPEAVPTHIEAQDIPLRIVYEDSQMLVVDKPPGLTVHPAPGHRDGTLVNALLAHCGESLSGIGGVARPGIVHRIDKDTSGLLAVAKTDAAHAALSAQLSARELKRTYRAIVWGVPAPAEGRIEGAIGRSPVNRQKMAIVKQGGKEAVTYYKVLEAFAPQGKPLAALVECRLETGRTHQIRVHLSARGHPLLGDPLYGAQTASRLAGLKKTADPAALAVIAGFTRQALHAWRLGGLHPSSGEPFAFEASLPKDMEALLGALREL